VILNDIPRKQITKYKGISISGISKDSYYELLYDGSIVKSDKDCPESKVYVGIIDTLNNKLCLDSNKARPISYVSLSNNEPQGISNIKTITGTNINLYYSTDPYPDSTTEKPKILSVFKIPDYDTMCSVPNLYSFSYTFHVLDAFKKDYADKCVLLNDYANIQKYTKDHQNYHSLDSIEMYSLYQENNIINIIHDSGLKDYGFDVDVYKNRNLKIYVRMHYGFDKECLDKRKTKLNVETLGLIYGRSDKMITWANYVLFIISTLIVSVLDLASCTTWSVVEPFIKYIFVLVPSAVLTIYTFVATGYDDPYEENLKCSDVITNDNFNIMISRVKSGGNKIFVTSILLVFLLIVNIVQLILRICIQCQKK
jgi:hypothetical protein